MKHKDETWGWMLAMDFFFAGMGGAMLLIAGIADLFLGKGMTSILGNFLGPIFIAVGAGLLIFELGRPLQAWRVFLKPKAILTFGAWSMLAAIGCGLAFASFGIPGIPWGNWLFLQKILAVLCVITGLVVATYPGVLLGRHKSRPFWNGPGMVGLFLTSSLVTGSAAHSLSGLIWPPENDGLITSLRWIIAGLLTLQLVFWLAYIWIKRTGGTEWEANATQRWIRGDLSLGFWGGLIAFGTLLPLILQMLPGVAAWVVGDITVLLGGGLMRWMVIKSGEQRTWLPGEEFFRSRLPKGDEAFLKAWK
jgi:protein NrfD